MDNLKSLRQRTRDTSAFKKEKQMQEEDRKLQDQEQEMLDFQKFKDNVYGIQIKEGGLIRGKRKELRGTKFKGIF